MIRLTRCHRPDHAGDYFRLHLQSGDSPTHPAAPGITLRPSWIGSALASVKISPLDPPTVRQIVRLGRGLHPAENKRLAPAKNRKRAYYDLTISSPKTITIAALLQPNHPVAKSVMQAHMGAVEAVSRAAGKMIQPQNARGAGTDKWLGVMFHHTHTRENDPHLHSHLILPNLMLNKDGQWRAMQVVIAGPNRLKLELLYGHILAIRLRRLGFGPEIVMLPSGLPELRTLQPMVRTFSKARIAVLEASRAAESERATKEGAKESYQQGSRPRVLPVGFHPDDLLNRRRRLADRMRQPKPKAADDPVKLSHEAERWSGEISSLEYRTLGTLLDKLDYTNSRRQAVIGKEAPPPPAREIIKSAAFLIPEGVKFTGPVLFRQAVVLSGGRHHWEELLDEARARMARRKKALARIKAQIEADSIAIAQAEIEKANRTVVLRGRGVEIVSGEVSAGGVSVAPAPFPEVTPTPVQATEVQVVAPTKATPEITIPLARPTGGRRRR